MTKIPSATRGQRTQHEEIHDLVQQRIADELPALVEHLIDLAQGCWVEDVTPDGKRRVYQKEPNLIALQTLFDRNMGRPIQRKEEMSVTGTPADFASLMKASRERFEAAMPKPPTVKVLSGPSGMLTAGAEAATEGAQPPTQQPRPAPTPSTQINPAQLALMARLRGVKGAGDPQGRGTPS